MIHNFGTNTVLLKISACPDVANCNSHDVLAKRVLMNQQMNKYLLSLIHLKALKQFFLQMTFNYLTSLKIQLERTLPKLNSNALSCFIT